jgi:formamidopyrimidine-DNA glycosylase
MPELPEVETIARSLRSGNGSIPLPERRIKRFQTSWPRHVDRPSISAFRRRVNGQTIRAVDRRAKYLVFPLDQGTLLVHLRMSGDLFLRPPDAEQDDYVHSIFHLDNGWQLRFSDARKFGRLYWTLRPEEVLGKLGPEPLEDAFTPELLTERLHARRRQIKPLLLDQSFLAGMGNIYVDEALHRARIHPMRQSDNLSKTEVARLWESIRTSLEEGIRHNGASIDWVYRGGNYQNHFRVYKQDGNPCQICGTAIQRMVVGQRGTYYCPSCQRENSL